MAIHPGIIPNIFKAFDFFIGAYMYYVKMMSTSLYDHDKVNGCTGLAYTALRQTHNEKAYV